MAKCKKKKVLDPYEIIRLEMNGWKVVKKLKKGVEMQKIISN
jgi:hypothetical protein